MLNLLQDLGCINTVRDKADNRNIIAAEEQPDLVVVALFWVALWQDTGDGTIDADVASVIGEEDGEEKDDSQDRPWSMNNQPIN